jgi:hypothetical protein
VQLAGGGGLLRAVRLAVDHHAARAADALAAVVVERHRLRTVEDQLLVEDVHELEERHVLVGVVDAVGDETTLVLRTVLSPDPEVEPHL